MDKQIIMESILKTVKKEITEWLDEHDSITDPFEYEKNLSERSLRIGRSMLENSSGKISRDRNVKKNLDGIWQGLAA